MVQGQQAGIGLGRISDKGGTAWSGTKVGDERAANQPRQIQEKRSRVFLDFDLDNRPLGRVVIELLGDVCPKAAENFRCLCTGEKGVSGCGGATLHYKGCKMHRIIPGGVIQGGDITKGDGTGGVSIYNQDGDGTFEDETFKIKHDRPGVVCMAHRDHKPDTNNSQFYFLTKENPKHDGQSVVFGRVVEGIDRVLKIESVGHRSGRPTYEVKIVNCGEVETVAMNTRKRKHNSDGEEKLAAGWSKKESRSKPGLFYYQHESGHTQFEKPKRESDDPLADADERRKIRKQERDEVKQELERERQTRQCKTGEARVHHILRKHRDFFGKPASSSRQKTIQCSKNEAKEFLEKIHDKLKKINYGGGLQAMKQKFENFAQLESDDDMTRGVGGDLGFILKGKRLFGCKTISDIVFSIKVGDTPKIVETQEGVHLVGRFE